MGDSTTRTRITTRAPGVSAAADAARRAEAARAPKPPAHAEEATWRDPDDDLNVRSRAPKIINGYRRGDALFLQARRGRGDITDAHISAVRIFRGHWDIAIYGFTSSDPASPVVSANGCGPRAGPTAAAHQRAESQREIVRVRTRLGESAWPMLIWVAVQNNDVKAWCVINGLEGNDRQRKQQGRLIAILDILAEHFGTVRS